MRECARARARRRGWFLWVFFFCYAWRRAAGEALTWRRLRCSTPWLRCLQTALHPSPWERKSRRKEGGKEGRLKGRGGISIRTGGEQDTSLAGGEQSHSQVKDQVMEAFLCDAVVEPHCGERRSTALDQNIKTSKTSGNARANRSPRDPAVR